MSSLLRFFPSKNRDGRPELEEQSKSSPDVEVCNTGSEKDVKRERSLSISSVDKHGGEIMTVTDQMLNPGELTFEEGMISSIK